MAIRRKCDREAGLAVLLANCVKSDARRIPSKSGFREYSESDIVHRLEQSMHNHRTPLINLSVVYATEGPIPTRLTKRRFTRGGIRLVLERPRHKRRQECTDLGAFVFSKCSSNWAENRWKRPLASGSFQILRSQSQIGLHELLCVLKSDAHASVRALRTCCLECIVFVWRLM